MNRFSDGYKTNLVVVSARQHVGAASELYSVKTQKSLGTGAFLPLLKNLVFQVKVVLHWSSLNCKVLAFAHSPAYAGRSTAPPSKLLKYE